MTLFGRYVFLGRVGRAVGGECLLGELPFDVEHVELGNGLEF